MYCSGLENLHVMKRSLSSATYCKGVRALSGHANVNLVNPVNVSHLNGGRGRPPPEFLNFPGTPIRFPFLIAFTPEFDWGVLRNGRNVALNWECTTWRNSLEMWRFDFSLNFLVPSCPSSRFPTENKHENRAVRTHAARPNCVWHLLAMRRIAGKGGEDSLTACALVQSKFFCLAISEDVITLIRAEDLSDLVVTSFWHVLWLHLFRECVLITDFSRSRPFFVLFLPRTKPEPFRICGLSFAGN